MDQYPPPPPPRPEQRPLEAEPFSPHPPSGGEPWQQQYIEQQPPAPPRTNTRGLLGWLLGVLLAIWGYAKYAILLVGKFGVVKTGLTLLVSLGAYALFFGWWFAAGLVLMILLHEMGHVLEIRRQGMRATAPVFIPFMGAAIFQRQHPQDALKQAQIGIAGPIAGTIAATAAFVLFGSTHSPVILVWAWLGFNLNLFNLIPFGMLDGGWILAAASKWFQVIGLAFLAYAVFFAHLLFGPLLLLLLLFGIPTMIERFRNDKQPYYQTVPVPARLAIGLAWLFLVAYLGIASMQTFGLLQTYVR